MEKDRIINKIMESKKNIEEELEVIDFTRRMDVGVDSALVNLRIHKRKVIKVALEEAKKERKR